MKKQLIAVRLSEQQAKQLSELEQAGFGNQSDIIRTALDRMHQASYDFSHAPFTDDLLKAEDQLRLRFVDLARLMAAHIDAGWVDVISGKKLDSAPEHYCRYRYALVDDSGVENFLRDNEFLTEIR